ncbi:unnamed protein product [Cylindrotheca closterium]|uniref:J domain-containing protein n=1 Tax=Cylindrotheca closterium TaxID=2856 RepID=A0AAD2CHJ0_9STRA|nr:unnamed protein product [Cylindrotheca closterium]
MAPNIDDPFAVLGIANDASEAEVKKAYRKLALKYHPDRQNGKSDEEIAAASDMFVKIAEAQDMLTDPVKRYDFRMKQEAQANKISPSAANRGRPTPPGSSSAGTRRPTAKASTVRKPVPMNRQASTSSMRRGHSPRSMNKKQGSVRAVNKPVLGRNLSDQPPKRVTSVGSLASRSAHVPRTNPNRMQQNSPFNPHKPPPITQNRSKTANMLRTPSNASMMSKKKKKKPAETTYTFVRNNGKTPPLATPASGDASPKVKKKKKKKKKPEAEQTFTFVRNNKTSDVPKKKKKKKPEAESEQTFTFVRNSTKSPKVDSTIKMRRRNSNDSAKKQQKADKRTKMKKNTGSSALDSSSRSLKSSRKSPGAASRANRIMMSPQQAPRKSILGFGRTSVQNTPQSARGKKKAMGIKGFLGRPPMETSNG